jgi:hypothetical protein
MPPNNAISEARKVNPSTELEPKKYLNKTQHIIVKPSPPNAQPAIVISVSGLVLNPKIMLKRCFNNLLKV